MAERPKVCQRCGIQPTCVSPDYGHGYGAEFRHWCPRTGQEESVRVDGYTKEMAYADADKLHIVDYADRING